MYALPASHGENRGSSPLGSAPVFQKLELALLYDGKLDVAQ